ncbi:hypothetical protein AFE_3106 [Acidithiobacillus ferrooxidans ATCC 23270]|uniref:Uncharacterized protein n=1 Tax=Acidithiobacillus ferrooxidans (strain ATCC 23270 / DSM 14882 / CIP 104768 / NCIMB 8455) TaxID=243159 RepID=B7JAL0_ACIF2|nr:hypothetical protein AFE_3106 [Acidithiobacillus ferrooxidans ATCC 23270]
MIQSRNTLGFPGETDMGGRYRQMDAAIEKRPKRWFY